MADKDTNQQDKEIERCLVCGSSRVHVYPPESSGPRALCLNCGACCDETIGWIDPEAL